MFARLRLASVALGELFSGGTFFSVPVFQRPFDWGPDEALQLLDDVSRAAGIDAPDDGLEPAEPDYFLGTLLLLTSPENEPPGAVAGGGEQLAKYEIIDGQQRLTTLTILFCVLRDMGVSGSALSTLIELPQATAIAEPAYRIRLNGRDRGLFQDYVQATGGTRLEPDDNSQVAETDAACIASSKLLSVRQALIEALRPYDQNQREVLANFLTGKCHVVATLSFDLERSHRLFTVLNERGKPLRRNDIIKVQILGELETAQRASAMQMWEEAEALLGDSFETFFGHLKVLFGRRRGSVIEGLKGMIGEAGGADAFVKDVLVPYARVYGRMRSSRALPVPVGDPVSLHFYYLWRVRGEEWVPAAMLALKMYATSPETALSLVRAIDRLAHLTRIQCDGSGRRTTAFGRVTKAILAGEAKTGAEEVFALKKEQVRNVKFHLRDLHRRNQPICKLLLLRINDHLDGKVTLVDPKTLSVEHVLPNRPSAASGWRVLYPEHDVREMVTQSLGNLTLLPDKLNDRMRNRDFEHKRTHLAEHFGDDEMLALVRDVTEAAKWDFETVCAREQRLLGALSEILGLDVRDVAIVRRADTKYAAE